MASQRIRIKLRSYDHAMLDQSAGQIVQTAKKTGAMISRAWVNADSGNSATSIGTFPLPDSRLRVVR